MSGKIIGAFVGMICMFGGGAAYANSSTYTDIDFDACEKITEYEDGVQLKCAGYQDYPVYFKEGDLREAVIFGQVKQLLIDEGFESFGPFNSVNNKIEWRLDDGGKPVAAILRWFVDNINPDTGASDETTRGQVLVVSRVADADEDGLSCVVGYVDALANGNANTLARNVADNEAASFACGYNEPMWWGERGDRSGDTMRYLPESLRQE